MITTTIALPARKQMFAVGGICSTSIYRVDQIHQAPAKLLADRMEYVVDGMALSAAYAFQRLGGHSIICGRVGDDPQGVSIRASLAAEGFDVSAIHVSPGSVSSRVAVVVDANGERIVVAFHDPNAEQSPHWLPLEQIAAADLVHCDLRWPEGAKTALIEARKAGVPSMLDGDVAPRESLQALVPLADYAVFSDAGILRYTGCDCVEEALLLVGQRHHGHVGASCGADGYYWFENGHILSVGAPKVNVVDTLSAGDIFHGAFALAILENKTIADSAAFACAAASLKCQTFGGRNGCPTREEVEAVLQTMPR